ncbi:MOSC domain-containing protein [Natrialba chahannaoensis JCM 10990]|uniref:MOSC domain-containing protein n=1 Tax=Natrialba chahannaoensis JCM 10990 TaxID=1227492 RepID=M0ARA8_9EURY|nr:MOSC domain-containing protein [Natrialba chahannaoensis]ELY99918.1 MOSC domain-containing protein [Natrialba chahannaoensis JCM 10990]
MTGRIHAIHIAPEQGAPLESVERVEAVAGRGLAGDRYYTAEGTFENCEGSDLTLIERETLAAVEQDYDIDLEPGVHRRNVTTADVALNHLVGNRFRVGNAVCEGIELCEPCSYLERHLEREGVRDALVHRGGLRARILESATLETGDQIVTVTADNSETGDEKETNRT